MGDQAFKREVWKLLKAFIVALGLYWWGKSIEIIDHR
jgi:hypothetical protein